MSTVYKFGLFVSHSLSWKVQKLTYRVFGSTSDSSLLPSLIRPSGWRANANHCRALCFYTVTPANLGALSSAYPAAVLEQIWLIRYNTTVLVCCTVKNNHCVCKSKRIGSGAEPDTHGRKRSFSTVKVVQNIFRLFVFKLYVLYINSEIVKYANR